MHKQGIAFFAGFTPEFYGQTYFRCHGNLPCRSHILRSQLWVSFADFLGLLKEYLDSLPSYLLNIGLLLHRYLPDNAKEVKFTYIILVLKLTSFLGKLKLQQLQCFSHLKRLTM